ncbi:MAG: GxxExxY protein [Patescibacteria group bacterium]
MTIITKSGKPLIYEKVSYILRELWMRIYNQLGQGHKESVYGNAFEKLLKRFKIPYSREPVLNLMFEDEKMGTYRPDFIVWNKIIVEFKSLEFIPKVFIKKVYQYLITSGHQLAFIVNFGMPKLEIIRRIYDKNYDKTDYNESHRSVKSDSNPLNLYGFTLIELLIVISITSILMVAAIPIYGNLQVTTQLNENTSQIIQSIRTARVRSVAGYNNSEHGVYFEINFFGNDKYILYQGPSYLLRSSAYDKENILDKALSFNTIGFILSNGKDVDINFSKGLGMSNNAGDIILTHDVDGDRNITVNEYGKIEEE